MKREDVVFKGTKGGLVIILDGKQDFSVLTTRLKEKLSPAATFFKDASVIVNVASRRLGEGEIRRLKEIISVEHGLRLLEVINEPEAGEEVEDFSLFTDESDTYAASETAAALPALDRIKVNEPRVAEKKGEEKELGDANTFLVKRTLRSGQHIRYDGNVAVLGDVNPGAEIIASGDILVLGSFRGVAHAGATGNEKSIVAAFRLNPTQLRIANFITRAPDGDVAGPAVPEVARIKDGRVVIEAFWMHN